MSGWRDRQDSPDMGLRRRPAPLPAAAFDLDEVRTYSTIAAMETNVRGGLTDGRLMALARSLTAGARSTPEALRNIFAWLQAHIRFVEDSANSQALGRLCRNCELLIAPSDLIRMRDPQGDCDEFAQLGKALILAAALPVSSLCFRTVAANRDTGEYSHVYLMVDGVAFDASHGPRLGWEARRGEQTRFGASVAWTGKQKDWCAAPVAPAVSRLHGLGSTLTDTLIAQIPGAVETAREVALRRGTPTGYYRAEGPGGSVQTRGAGGALALPSFSGSSSFPWAWMLGLGVVLLLVKGVGSGGRR